MVAIMLSASMLVSTGARQVFAQDAPPNLRMLLNLDLFESRSSSLHISEYFVLGIS